MSKKTTGHTAMLIGYIFFGMNLNISKYVLDASVNPMGLNGIRFLFGALAFWFLSLFKQERVERKDLIVLFLASLFGLLINQVLFFQGLTRTSPIDSSVITTSIPIITMLLSALILKEPITWLKVLGVIIGATGAILLVFSSQQAVGNGAGNMLGNLLVFGSCFSFSVYLVVIKPIIHKYSPITIMKWMFLFAAVPFVPFNIGNMRSIPFDQLSSDALLSLGYILVFATVIPYLLVPIGQRYLRPTTVAMYNYVQPLVAAILATFLGQDVYTLPKAFAAVLVFSGVYLVTRSKSRADLEKNSPHEA
ncbi:MAG: DMT family transporter [Bacteroidales bacterium]|jgi:drug/metabolite transporter (DMT)-like permease|nr:DMT family transporter [Bacteroidales bacterium]MDD4771395.1 DMT family transporter [Bacteroidales bacterium]HKL92488.1 DMT family transporter [Bacteroidales bacterium]